jgi:hypothetical protein
MLTVQISRRTIIHHGIAAALAVIVLAGFAGWFSQNDIIRKKEADPKTGPMLED